MKRKLLHGAGIITLSLAVSCLFLPFQADRMEVKAGELDSTWVVDDEDSGGSSWEEAAAETESTETEESTDEATESTLESAQVLSEAETQAESTWETDSSEGGQTEAAAAEGSAEEADDTFATGVEEHLMLYKGLLTAFLGLGAAFGLAAYKLKKDAVRELSDVNRQE